MIICDVRLVSGYIPDIRMYDIVMLCLVNSPRVQLLFLFSSQTSLGHVQQAALGGGVSIFLPD